MPLLVRDVLVANASVFGFISASAGVGEIIGGLVLGQVRIHRIGITMYAAAVFGNVWLAMYGLLPVYPLLLLYGVGLGMGFIGFGVLWDTAVQRHVPRELLGRVGSVDGFGSITVNALRITVTDPLNNNKILATVVLSSAHADVECPAGNGGPGGGIGGPCADPAYYGIFYNTTSTALTFRFQWQNSSGVHTVTKLVPAGATFRTWEHWSKPGTNLSVAYKNSSGNWVTLASDVSVHGYFPDCIYKHGFE
jgi:MFS family permease